VSDGHRGLRARAVVVAVVVAVAGLSLAPYGAVAGATGTAGPPQVKTSTPAASVGERVFVTGSGWSPVGETVLIQICGQDARNYSNDCNQQNQYTAAIRAGGIFYGALDVQLPPTPCPCVFSVTTPGSFTGVKVPLTIVGAPDVPIPTQAVPAHPVALTARIQSGSSVSSWFGGPRPVTLMLTVANLSSVALQTATLVVHVGHGPDPTGFVVARPMAALAVGSTRVVQVPVTIPPVTYGQYTVAAQVITGLGSATAAATTTTYPWGLLVVALAIVVGLVLMLVVLRRRRRRRRHQAAVLAIASRVGPIGVAPVPPVEAVPGAAGAVSVGAVPTGPGPVPGVLPVESAVPGAGTPIGPAPVPRAVPEVPWMPDHPAVPADQPAGVR
jgi:hypothetical protein